MKQCILICFLLFFSKSIAQEFEKEKRIKIKRKYSNEKLINEEYFNQKGQIIKFSQVNYNLLRSESVNGVFYPMDIHYDSLVNVFEYTQFPEQKLSYSYSVNKDGKSEIELTSIYFFENDLLIEEKNILKNDTISRLNFYNNQNDLIKVINESESTYLIEYEYNIDSLPIKKTKYIDNLNNLISKVEINYNEKKLKQKEYFYNHDEKLKSTITYFYDKKNQLIKTLKSNLDLYTNPKQKRDTKFIISYKYDDYGNVIEEKIFDDFMDRKGKTDIYKYEYEFY